LKNAKRLLSIGEILLAKIPAPATQVTVLAFVPWAWLARQQIGLILLLCRPRSQGKYNNCSCHFGDDTLIIGVCAILPTKELIKTY
jgi:hypothetical protein